MRKESGGKGKECAGKSVSLYNIIEIRNKGGKRAGQRYVHYI